MGFEVRRRLAAVLIRIAPRGRAVVDDVLVAVVPDHPRGDVDRGQVAVPFEAVHGEVARGFDAAFGVRKQDGQEAASGHLRNGRQAGRLEDGRGEVGESYEVGHGASSRGAPRPHDGEGHVHAPVVDVGLGARHRRAVIGGHDDDGVREFTAFFQHREQGAERAVGMLDFVEVVRPVGADALGVRQELRQLHVSEPDAQLLVVVRSPRGVRFGESGPEVEGATLGLVFQEEPEVGDVVDG